MSTMLGYVPDRADQDVLVSMCRAVQRGDDEMFNLGLRRIGEHPNSAPFTVSVAAMGTAAVLMACGQSPSPVKVATISAACYPRIRRIVGCSHAYLYDRLSELMHLPDAQQPMVGDTGIRNGEFDVLIPIVMLCLLSDVDDQARWMQLVDAAAIVARSTGGAR